MDKIMKRYRTVIGFGLVSMFIVFLISMNTGFMKLGVGETLKTLVGFGNEEQKLILFHFRLPRIVISILVGIGLSLSGCVIQGISKNPLAEPGLLGINAGAGLIVVIYLIFLGENSMLSMFTLPLLAFVGGLTIFGIIILLSTEKDGKLHPTIFLLSGVAIQTGVMALTTILVLKLDDTKYDFVAMWQSGSIWASNWKYILVLLPWVIGGTFYLMKKSKVLDLMNLDDEVSLSLGLSLEKERKHLMFCAVALAASCVSVSGNIGFIGLLAPQLSKKLVGGDHRVLLPTTAVIGGLIVLVADTVGRSIIQPLEVPTGIVVAIVGAPYFIYLLCRKRS